MWTCDERGPSRECRNPHGCHCAEIEHLVHARDSSLKENEKLKREILRCDDACIQRDKEIAALRAAISRIDAINDNPAHFSVAINEVCSAILRSHLKAPALTHRVPVTACDDVGKQNE